MPLKAPAQPWSRCARKSIRSRIPATHAASFSTDTALSLRWRSKTPEKIIAASEYIVGVNAREKSASTFPELEKCFLLAATCRLIGISRSSDADQIGSYLGFS